MPTRGNANGLNSDDDDEDDNDEESDELATLSNLGKGSRLGGQQFPSTDDSRSQSVLCMYLLHNKIIYQHTDVHIDEKNILKIFCSKFNLTQNWP